MKSRLTIPDYFDAWYRNLPRMKSYGDRPAKGTVAASLIVLERLRTNCKLNVNAHLAEGGAQIAGLSLAALRKVLERFDEARDFPSEGGRTNRGNNKPIRQLLDALNRSDFVKMAPHVRASLIDDMQRFLVKSLDAYYRLEQIRFEFDANRPARRIVGDILAIAEKRSQSGPVAQHLVGAKLQLRFPRQQIANRAFSAADEQSGQSGDFRVGKTAFHVTVAPTLGHAERCRRNRRGGIQAFLIVPDSKILRTRVLLEEKGVSEYVAIESVESFVGQNVSELAEFSPDRFASTFGDLLTVYNLRVKEAERDTSLLIEIPAGIRGDRQSGQPNL